jgi:hypothetical protein
VHTQCKLRTNPVKHSGHRYSTKILTSLWSTNPANSISANSVKSPLCNQEFYSSAICHHIRASQDLPDG